MSSASPAIENDEQKDEHEHIGRRLAAATPSELATAASTAVSPYPADSTPRTRGSAARVARSSSIASVTLSSGGTARSDSRHTSSGAGVTVS